MTPGRKFSITTSARAASSLAVARSPSRLQVEGDPPLAPVEVGVNRAERACRRRGVDVHDVGARLGQQESGQRTGDLVPEVDDPDAGESDRPARPLI